MSYRDVTMLEIKEVPRLWCGESAKKRITTQLGLDIFPGIAEAGVVLAAAIRLANGRWGGPIMRIGESLSSYLPFGIATMVILLTGGIWTYLPWIGNAEPRLTPFLNVPFLYVRTLGGLLLF